MTKQRPRRQDRESVDVTAILETGMAPSEDHTGRRLPPPSTAELRQAWIDIGDRLTAEHIEGEPGTRPWAWWAFGPGRAILDGAGREWPLTQIGRAGGVRIRNRLELSAHEQRRILSAAGLLTPEELSR